MEEWRLRGEKEMSKLIEFYKAVIFIIVSLFILLLPFVHLVVTNMYPNLLFAIIQVIWIVIILPIIMYIGYKVLI